MEGSGGGGENRIEIVEERADPPEQGVPVRPRIRARRVERRRHPRRQRRHPRRPRVRRGRGDGAGGVAERAARGGRGFDRQCHGARGVSRQRRRAADREQLLANPADLEWKRQWRQRPCFLHDLCVGQWRPVLPMAGKHPAARRGLSRHLRPQLLVLFRRHGSSG